MSHPKPLGPFGRLAQAVLANRRAVLVGALVVSAISALGASRLGVDSNLLALLPRDDPSSQALRALHAEGGANLLTLSFQADDPAKLDPALDRVVEAVGALPSVRYAIHEIDPDLAFRLGLLQLSVTEVETLNFRLKGALALGPAMNPIVAQRLMDMGPLTEKISSSGKTGLFGDESSGQGRVLVRPTGSSNDPAFAAALIASVEQAIAKAAPEGDGVRMTWMGGAYRHNVEDREGIQQDIAWTSVASGILVLLSVVIAFRSLRATALLYGPLVLASAMNLALVWLIYGSVNTYTSFGTAILLGLGIDYGTHLVARYRELRSEGHGIDEAVVTAWDRVGPPCTTSCLTASAAFLSLATAQFQGFSQLGITLGIGLLVTLAVALVLTPALIPWLYPDPPPPLTPPVPTHAEGRKKSTYRMAPIGLMFAVVLTCLAATRLPKIGWEFDISHLRRDGMAYEELSEEERKLARDSYSPVVMSFPTQDELVREHHRLQGLIDEGKLPHVARIVSLESVLPSDQDARVHALAELSKLAGSPNLRYLPPPITKNLLRLKGFEARSMTSADLPPAALTLLGAGDAGDKHRILLFAKGNMWDLRETAALRRELMAAVPDRVPAGEFVAQGALYETVMEDMPVVALLSLVMVAILTAIDLRRLHGFLTAFGTLVAGLVWAGVAIERLGVRLSILNVVGVPILVGIAIDICIHLFHRLREEGPGGVRRALQTTGFAAVISTANTVTSFGALMLAGNRGIRSLGLLVAVGLSVVFVVSLIFLPLAFSATWRVTGRAPGDTRRKKGTTPAPVPRENKPE